MTLRRTKMEGMLTILKTSMYFVRNNWEWLTGFLISLTGVLISYKAYRYSMQANKDTNELIKIALSDAINTNNKEQIREKLLETAVSEWRLKGQAKDFLLDEFKRLEPKGWTKEEFKEIYEQASIRKKGKKPKQPLFGG